MSKYDLIKKIIGKILDMSYDEQMELASKLNIIAEEEPADNKRQHPRKEVFIPADIKIDEGKVVDFIEDISEGGVFVRLSKISLHVGQTISLDFTYNGIEHANIKGKIVRITDGGIGIKFVEKK